MSSKYRRENIVRIREILDNIRRYSGRQLLAKLKQSGANLYLRGTVIYYPTFLPLTQFRRKQTAWVSGHIKCYLIVAWLHRSASCSANPDAADADESKGSSPVCFDSNEGNPNQRRQFYIKKTTLDKSDSPLKRTNSSMKARWDTLPWTRCPY